MKLTRAEKQQVRRACELIETNQCKFNCYALGFHTNLSIVYGIFYNKKRGSKWWPTMHHENERIIALLLFAEAAGDVLP